MRLKVTVPSWLSVLSLLAMTAYVNPALGQWSAVESAPSAAPATSRALRHKQRAPLAEPPDVGIDNVKPKVLDQYGNWGAYLASPGGRTICFASAQPTSSETDPPGSSRNPIFIFISSRPADKTIDEISILVGYPFQPKSEATLEVGSASFVFATKQGWRGSKIRPKNLI
jgi:hypothetical protein